MPTNRLMPLAAFVKDTAPLMDYKRLWVGNNARGHVWTEIAQSDLSRLYTLYGSVRAAIWSETH